MKQQSNIDKILDGMTGPQLAKAIKSLKALQKKASLSLWDQYDVQDHQRPVHADKRKIITIMGGNRCLGGEQEIYDPVANISRRVDSIQEDFHVWAWDGQKRVIAKAHRPFQKLSSELVRLTFDTQTSIVASPQHLFWGPQGWTECSLYVSRLESIASHPETNWGIVHSIHPEDAEHLTYIALDSQYGCPKLYHSYGEQLPEDQATCQDVLTSQGDALGHISRLSSHSYEPLDDQGDKRAHSHVCLGYDHPSIQGGLRHLVAHGVDIGSQYACMSSTQVLETPPIALQSIDASCLLRSIAVIDLQAIHNPYHSVSPSSLSTSNSRVVKIEYLRKDIVWDFEVEAYHNYFIGDILSHNSGKSHCAGYSMACHITGIYPDWWEGLRFHEPVDAGVISISAEQLRKSAQVKLMGEPHALGTGFIHPDLIIDKSWRQGTNGCLDWVLIKHASGGTSRIEFMSCEQEQKKFMGFARKLIWFDEEPPLNIFNEIQMRLIDLKGYIILSFYPYAGETELIQMLDKMPEKYCGHYQFSMEDNRTLDQEEVEMHKLTMPDWLKESRMYGRPGAGEGRIFTFSKDDYVCEPFEIEPSWRQIAGLDVGFGHATGAVRIAYDDQAFTAYVFQEYISTKNLPVVHASALRRWGDIDFKIDTSSHRASPTDGKNLFDMYVDEGLSISNANTSKGSVQTSINMINTMLAERRLFIFNTCPELIRQMGLYRMTKNQKTGQVKVIEKDDDLIDPLRYGIMGLDEARVPGTHKIKAIPKIIQWAPVDPRIGI